ncbi:MAG: hypothetical protein ABWY47_09100, partial [Xanthobacteraceae bacterium]
MSWVFLTDDFAYKLKKPVRHARVDLRTLEARRRNCLTEIRLNRRLAPDVYLAMKPLTLVAHRGLQLAGDGDVVDWLVTMRRLPDELMLDSALRRGGPERRDLDRIASDSTALSRRSQSPPRCAASGSRRRSDCPGGN